MAMVCGPGRHLLLRSFVARSSPGDTQSTKKYYVPATLEENISQARLACRGALDSGLTRLQLEMPLPLIGATDLDDWPGGIQQQFKAAAPLVTSLLAGLATDEGRDAGFKRYLIDAGDAVAAWENDKVALVLFPTAESLPRIQAIETSVRNRPLLLMNPQWRGGQVISDFGYGAQKRSKEEFISTFEVVYFLQQLRISGDTVQLFKRYPGSWQVAIRSSSGECEYIAVEPEKPSYSRLQALLAGAKGSSTSEPNWLARMMRELLKSNTNSL